MEEYRKAIAGALSGLVTLAAYFVPGVEDLISAEIIAAIAVLAASATAYVVPNTIGGENVVDLAKKAKG